MEIQVIEWVDSYGATPSWEYLDNYKPGILIVVSCGVKIYEDDRVISIAPHYAEETKDTQRQATGTMVIPKVSIVRSTTFAFDTYLEDAADV